MNPSVISFDLGQTLVELDEQLLADQAKRSGYVLEPSLARSEQDASWQAYNAAKAKGLVGFDAWSAFMRDLLTRVDLRLVAGRVPVSDEEREIFVRFLWSEQPNRNLWRRPIPGMLELVERLSARGTKMGVLTNSEGRAKELVDTVGFGKYMSAVVDSGVEGIEKPDARIFARMAESLACRASDVVHVGDSFEADVLGALGAGMTPIWFLREPTTTLPPGVAWCRNVGELVQLLDLG